MLGQVFTLGSTAALGLIPTSVRVCKPCRGVVACSNYTRSCLGPDQRDLPLLGGVYGRY